MASIVDYEGRMVRYLKASGTKRDQNLSFHTVRVVFGRAVQPQRMAGLSPNLLLLPEDFDQPWAPLIAFTATKEKVSPRFGTSNLASSQRCPGYDAAIPPDCHRPDGSGQRGEAVHEK